MALSPKESLKRGMIAAALIFMLDQASKWWIVFKVMRQSQVIEITPFFNIVLGWNRGISFGMFNSESALPNLILPIIAIVIIGVLFAWLRLAGKTSSAIAIGLIIGGASGNVVDRLHYGAVADFLDFHVFGYHWPAFNIADSGIATGAFFLIVDSLFTHEKSNNIQENKE